jgi:hypothetical protein
LPLAIIMVILLGAIVWALRQSKRPALYNIEA